MITPPPNPKAQQARQAMIAYHDKADPQTQAELNAYVAASARIEIVWSEVEQHYYDAITVTLFDKRTAAEREAQA